MLKKILKQMVKGLENNSGSVTTEFISLQGLFLVFLFPVLVLFTQKVLGKINFLGTEVDKLFVG